MSLFDEGQIGRKEENVKTNWGDFAGGDILILLSPREHVWVVGPCEGPLQLLELERGEGGSVTPLLPPAATLMGRERQSIVMS